MLNNKVKKFIASTVLGLSILSAAGAAIAVAPTTVHAATSPKITLKNTKFAVNRGSLLSISKVVKKVSKGTYPIKSVKVKTASTANKSKFAISNKKLNATTKVPTGTIKPKKVGTYKIRIVATDTAGNKSTKDVSLVVSKKLSTYVTGIKNITTTVGSSVNYKKGIVYNANQVKSITVNKSAVNLNKAGTYKVVYTLTGKAGNTQTVTKKVTVKAGTTTSNTSITSYPDQKEDPTLLNYTKGIEDKIIPMGSLRVDLGKNFWYDRTKIRSIEYASPSYLNYPKVNAFGAAAPAGAWTYGTVTVQYRITSADGLRYYWVDKKVHVIDTHTAQRLVDMGANYEGDHGGYYKVITTGGLPLQPSADSAYKLGKYTMQSHTERIKIDTVYVCVTEGNSNDTCGNPYCLQDWATMKELSDHDDALFAELGVREYVLKHSDRTVTIGQGLLNIDFSITIPVTCY